MTSFDYGQLAYLVLLGGAVTTWFFVHNRSNLGKVAQQGLVWGLIFLGAIAAVGLWDDIRSTVSPRASVIEEQGRIEVPRGPDGHYHLTLEVNGVPVPFLVDTGASMVVLSKSDARRAGVDLDSLQYFGEAMTANGRVRTAPVDLESIGPFDADGMRAFVTDGEMEQSLLGMSYLQRFSSVSFSGGRLVLER